MCVVVGAVGNLRKPGYLVVLPDGQFSRQGEAPPPRPTSPRGQISPHSIVSAQHVYLLPVSLAIPARCMSAPHVVTREATTESARSQRSACSPT